MTKVLLPGTEVAIKGCEERGEDLWVPVGSLPTLGWELKPEGACRGDFCAPLPAGREAEFTDGNRFSFTALARRLGMPFESHAATDTWAFGESSETRNDALDSLIAPDFSLPDLSGSEHRLSDYRGKKVILLAWASW